MSRTVLVIDDSDTIRRVAALSLERVAGWTVLAADGGEAGAELARSHAPDAVLLDLVMPGLDGPGTLALLKGDPVTAGIPVILLSASTALAEEAARDLGVAGCLAKPFDPLGLAAAVAGVLGWEPGPG